MKKTQYICAYSIDFDLPVQVGDHSVKDLPRFALGNLLVVAGTLLLNKDKDEFDMESPSKLTLELETERWDRNFVLRIERMPDCEAEV